MSSLARRWRRALRLISRRLAGSALRLVYEPRYALDISGVGHDARRGERILGFLAAEGLVGIEDVLRPEPMSFHDLRRVHSDDYLESLGRPGALMPILGFSPADSLAEAFLEAQRMMAGGTRLALDLALGLASPGGGPAARRQPARPRRPAVNLGGGFHHAFRERGERFCAFNDVAAAVASLRSRGYEGKILIVDLDLHDGDGTRSILAGDARTHTLSIHNLTSAPEFENSTVVELGSGTGDEEYLAAIRATLPPLAERFGADLAIYLAGSDPAADDAIGDWRITPEGMFARDRFVVELLRSLKTPPCLAIVLAGGYGTGAWRYPARFLAWLASGREIEPPGSDEALLLRFRALAGTLSAHQLTAEDDGRQPAPGGSEGALDDWGLTADDLALGTGLGKPSRFLGFYSRSGVELALERAGLLERLRARGYNRPTIELDLGQGAGDMARLYGDATKRELLMEIRARLDRRLVPGVPLLHLEWLLLQDPRANFPPGSSGLPGQQHPGLGLLAEVMALLVAACDRLGLQGISFVPSYYHLAAKGRRLLRFLDPDDEARIASLEAALAGRPLAEATRLVAEGRVLDAETGEPFAWRPMVMILPTSEALAARFEDPEYERRAAVRREFRTL